MKIHVDPQLVITQHASPSYSPRTFFNAAHADLTIAIAADFTTAGEKLTKRSAGKRYHRVKLEGNPFNYVDDVVYAMDKREASIINIAGNGIYTLLLHHWLQADINKFVYDLLRIVHKESPIEKIISGGQTGVDTSGIVAAYALGIPSEMRMPLGCKRRGADGLDYLSSENQIAEEIYDMVKKLR